MAHPTTMQQLAKDRGREILETSARPRRLGVVHVRARERLGWSLVGLGVHLALKGRGSDPSDWHRAGVPTGRYQTLRLDG